MIAFLAAVVLTPLTYSFPSEKVRYDLDLQFQGFIPLFGGQDGSVGIQSTLTVKGLATESENHPRVQTDLEDLSISFDGTKLPFGRDNVDKYFPNTVTITTEGKVLKNDAPELVLPVQLPGLDVKRFPDMTFLILEFPPGGVELGKTWSYKREFGKSEVEYNATPTNVSDTEVDFDLKMRQEFSYQEDATHSDAKDPKDAEADVKTVVEGSGKVVFDRKLGLIRSSDTHAEAISQITDLKSKAVTSRSLKTKLKLTLHK